MLQLPLQYGIIQVSYKQALVYRGELLMIHGSGTVLVKRIACMIVVVMMDLGSGRWIQDRMILVARSCRCWLLWLGMLINHGCGHQFLTLRKRFRSCRSGFRRI